MAEPLQATKKIRAFNIKRKTEKTRGRGFPSCIVSDSPCICVLHSVRGGYAHPRIDSSSASRQNPERAVTALYSICMRCACYPVYALVHRDLQ